MISPGRIYIGAPQRLSINFQTTAGVDQDPTTLTFKSMSPEGNETTYVYGTDAEVVKTSTGDYYVDLTPDIAGRWHYRWVATGTSAGAQEGNFVVTSSPFVDDPFPWGYSDYA